MSGGRKIVCAHMCTYKGQKRALDIRRLDIQEFVGCLTYYLVLGSGLVVTNALLSVTN